MIFFFVHGLVLYEGRRCAPAPLRCYPARASEPDNFRELLASAEDFLAAEGIGDENDDVQPTRRRRPTMAKELKKPPKVSKTARQRVGCYGCGAASPFLACRSSSASRMIC